MALGVWRESGSESSLLGRRPSATPAGLAEENGHLPPVQSMCGTSAEVVWLPIAFSADVRMSVEQALRARCCAGCKLPKWGGISLYNAACVDMDVSTGRATQPATLDRHVRLEDRDLDLRSLT